MVFRWRAQQQGAAGASDSLAMAPQAPIFLGGECAVGAKIQKTVALAPKMVLGGFLNGFPVFLNGFPESLNGFPLNEMEMQWFS